MLIRFVVDGPVPAVHFIYLANKISKTSAVSTNEMLIIRINFRYAVLKQEIVCFVTEGITFKHVTGY
jgi:hypothetical protein